MVAAAELRGSSVFLRAPWKVDLRSYTTNVFERWAEYYFTLTLAEDAGAALAGLTIQQTRGADWQFPFSPERTRAFLGEPRQEGAPIAVQASFDQERRRFSLQFPEPIPPGNMITVVLRPWHNPAQADTYMFQVEAIPAGPNPVSAAVGSGTLRIYSIDRY
ncbi:DUF2808 domain-containing protein [Synechococcus sp. CS-1328]|uniref:DUF2808 domain-containing protein n=1 Tax=Synechococcus sp. CS-1328 TaxID=2847976 RepID=UPI00223AD8FA|nr:DUF2808 domain-containing protein [Synechococcus sp. CS-1328]MCT0226236.1 DUF2808 domain-containing protein [Synechococcus sp. CS-1328]